MESILGASVAVMAGLGLLALAVSALIAFLATGLAASGQNDDFRQGMLVLGFAYLLRFPLAAYGAVLTGYQRYDLWNAGQAVMIAGSAIGAVIAVEAGGGVLGIAVAYGVAFVAGGLTSLCWHAGSIPSSGCGPAGPIAARGARSSASARSPCWRTA